MTVAWNAAELRRAFTDFWVARGHSAVAAATLVPPDPTVMFTIAGMVPFKDYFTRREVPPYTRATTIQPCVRTVDIDVIGTTARHLTFFEMLGHFSFGDYFKAEAIPWCWELYSEVLGLEPDRLWVTVHETDDEAEKIWVDSVGFPAARVQRMGEDNFWKMGETGPCGPCSELFFDRGGAYGAEGGPAHGGPDRYVEIGNLVFMQFERKQAGGDLLPLAAPSIDFGGGLERVLASLEGSGDVFDTDVLRPMVTSAENLTGRRVDSVDAGADSRLKVMADHSRTIVFVAAEGVVPSNEGRGFVLRRLIRRVVMKAAQLGLQEAVMPVMIDTVVATMGSAYPHIVSKASAVSEVVAREEEAFRRTLASGMAILEEHLAGGEGETLDGETAFLLHDTHGFPIDLTREIAAERGLEVDMEGFEAAMSGQRVRARQALKGSRAALGSEEAYREILERVGTSDFLGYATLETEAEILGVVDPVSVPEFNGAGEPIPPGTLKEVFLSATPFYAESGGQVGDTGTLTTPSGSARVVDTTYALPALIRHLVVVTDGDLVVGEIASARVDAVRRGGLRRNHTGTHLLHWGLRRILGDHVHQQGSLVAPDRLRFDFSHFSPVGEGARSEIEDLVNGSVLADSPVHVEEMSRDDALHRGALAFFKDKYGSRVRVVEAGESVELCGGTHVDALGMIGPVKIVSEGSVGAGIRRIEAVTGAVSLEYVRSIEERLERAARSLKVPPDEVPEALERLLARVKAADEEIKSFHARQRTERATSLAESGVGGVVVSRVDGLSSEELRELAAAARARPGMKAVVLVGSPDGERVALVAAVAKGSAVAASDLIAEAARATGGGTGRSQDLAVAGGRDVSRIDEALGIARRRSDELLGAGASGGG